MSYGNSRRHFPAIAVLAIGALLSACSPGDEAPETGVDTPGTNCTGSCVTSNSFLTVTDIETILSHAIFEAQERSASATIAVVDRVGNVLAVFRMNNADTEITIDSGRDTGTGLDGIEYIPDTLAAISKAITAAYLSSEGNAFTTRTASQIVQQHFNPGESGQPGGPLFGVQFSNLPCSDLNTRFTIGADIGPKRSPLGLSADPGGLPLYKGGTPVGGIGVIADGIYGLDADISDFDSPESNIDELIALAGSFGFAAPLNRRADRITADGKNLRFTDAGFDDLASDPNNAPAFATFSGDGSLLTVDGYFDGAILDGVAFSTAASGIRPDNNDYPDLDAFVLVDNANINRFPPIAGSDGPDALTENEVRQLLRSALAIANQSRAQIRQPQGNNGSSPARVSVSIVDTNGEILGVVRSRDAPVFGTDVSLQKARTAAFFSNTNAAADLSSAPDARYPDRNIVTNPPITTIVLGDYVTAAQNFLGLPTALTDGAYAFSDRAGGNLSRPYYPDGLPGAPHGPFSKPFISWSPFSTGLQLDLNINQIIGHVAFVIGLSGVDVTQNCTTIGSLANGIQIFPGSMPIYRNNVLIGGIGVSGDGVDQDDMIAFLGLHEAGQTLDINNAPVEIRADILTPQGNRLRYVQCPQAPFLNSNEQNVCHGK
jgi:uncharacterized protein GlcG (DUF336 family)